MPLNDFAAVCRMMGKGLYLSPPLSQALRNFTGKNVHSVFAPLKTIEQWIKALDYEKEAEDYIRETQTHAKV